jgi:hypothetical protein
MSKIPDRDDEIHAEASLPPPKLEERRRKSEGGSRNPPSRHVYRRITPIGPCFARTDGLQSALVLSIKCTGLAPQSWGVSHRAWLSMKLDPGSFASRLVIMRILQAVVVILVAGPSFAADLGRRPHQADLGPRLHRFVGVIEGTGETLVGSVFIGFQRSTPAPRITLSTSTGTICTGQLSRSVFGGVPQGAFSCSDGRTAQFTWGDICAEALLLGGGYIAGQKFRFHEELPNSCKPID